MPTLRVTRTLSWSVVVFAAGIVMLAGCDEDRPTQVTQVESAAPHPNDAPADDGKNPISGNRKSTLGKAYDVAEDLVDNKIPEYQKRVNEEQEKTR